MLASDLNRPQVVGTVPPEVLEQIGEYFPEEQARQNWLGGSDNEDNYYYGSISPEVRRVLAPLKELVMEHVMNGPEPAEIEYSINTLSVAAHDVPREGYTSSDASRRAWHPYYIKKPRLYVASSLPDVFLVKDPESRFSWQRLNGRHKILSDVWESRSNGLQDFGESTLAAAGVELYQPNPYEVILVDGHIHRGTMNSSDNRVERVSVTAAVLPKQ